MTTERDLNPVELQEAEIDRLANALIIRARDNVINEGTVFPHDVCTPGSTALARELASSMLGTALSRGFDISIFDALLEEDRQTSGITEAPPAEEASQPGGTRTTFLRSITRALYAERTEA